MAPRVFNCSWGLYAQIFVTLSNKNQCELKKLFVVLPWMTFLKIKILAIKSIFPEKEGTPQKKGNCHAEKYWPGVVNGQSLTPFTAGMSSRMFLAIVVSQIPGLKFAKSNPFHCFRNSLDSGCLGALLMPIVSWNTPPTTTSQGWKNKRNETERKCFTAFVYQMDRYRNVINVWVTKQERTIE